MDTSLLPTGALHPGRGRPVSPGQAGPAASGAEPAATGGPRTASARVEITISADARSFLAEAESSDGSGGSGLSPAHLARSAQFRALAVDTYKTFGQLVSAIARGLEDPGAAEPEATDETAAVPATELSVLGAEDGAGIAAGTDEGLEANAAADPDGAAAEDPELVGENDGMAGEPAVVVETDSLEDTLLEALDGGGPRAA